jgi:hypothetical protein
MTLPHLPGKLAKIGRKNSSRFQIVGIQDHTKTRFIAGFQSSEIKNGRTDVGVLTDAEVAEMRSKFESEEFFIAEQIGVPPLHQELWAYSSGATESDHAWHEFFALRPVEENDLIEGVPWGTAGALFDAIANATPWNELLSPHWEVACR